MLARARTPALRALDHNLCLYAGLGWGCVAAWTLAQAPADAAAHGRQVGYALLITGLFLTLGLLMEFWRLTMLFGRLLDLQGRLAEAYAGRGGGSGWASRHRLR